MSLFKDKESFLGRETLSLFVVPSKELALTIHQKERVNLIIIDLETPSMRAEEFCSLIRHDNETRNVSIVLLHPDRNSGGERVRSCGANAVISHQLEPLALFETARKLLDIRERAFFRSTLGIKVQGTYNNKPFICFSENISASGMLVESEKVLPLGERIMCGFYLPDSTHVVCEAEIVRVVEKKNDYDTRKYGLRFTEIKETLTTAIQQYVNGKRGKK